MSENSINYSMFKTYIFPILLLGLGYVLFSSEDVKTIIAGIAVFLIGMVFMEDGFKLFSGGLLESILEKATSNVPKAIVTGFVATSIVQSSSLLTIIIISFLSAELISLSGAIGVIFGSNIGSTTTAWIVSAFGVNIKIAHYAMPMLIFGVIFRFNESKVYQGLGNVLVGLGFVFLGIGYMKEGFEVMKDGLDLAKFAMDGYLGVLVYILIGAVATVIIQSSAATMALVITAIATGQIEYTNALSIAIGANIGTTVTAFIGSLSSNANGKRLAIAHFIFNVITAFIAILTLYWLIDLVDFIASKIAIEPENYAMKLALFHTVFNIIGVAVISPFTKQLVSFIETLFNEKREDISRARYLDGAVVEVPEAALVALHKEIIHLYDNSSEMFSHALSLHRHTYIGMNTDIKEVVKSSVTMIDINLDEAYKKKIKSLYGDIISFAALAQKNMNEEQQSKAYTLKIACRDIVEAIKDVQDLQKNVNRFMKSKNENVRNEYNFLREYIAKTLDAIHILKVKGDDFDILSRLAILEEHLSELDMLREGRIDNLIRTNKIESKVATSFINDSQLAYNITKKLINVAKTLWIKDRQIQELGALI